MKLTRTLEPEAMDSQKEAQEYNDMDHSEVNERFVTELLDFLKTDAWFTSKLDPDAVEEDEDFEWIDVLDVGTGTALIPVELCERTEEFRIMAIDMAVSMLELAVYNVEANSLGHRIQLSQTDAKTMGYPNSSFDVVMSNSIIHHIPEPTTCVEQIHRVIRPGGAIFVRDLMRPESSEAVDELVATYMNEESEFSQKLFRDSLHAALTLDEMRDLVSQFGFDGNTVCATSDRHWTWAAFAQ